MFCKVINGQVCNLQEREFDGSIPVVAAEVNHKDPDKRVVGFEFKIKKGYVLQVPVYIERSQEDRAKIRRQLAESACAVEYNNVGIRANDKAIAMLQGYIQSSVASVEWKGIDRFITLSLQDMQAVLNLMMTKRAELFKNEKDESQ